MSLALARRLLIAAAVVIAGGSTLSCDVNDYCLNCAVPGDGGDGDAMDGGGDANDGGDGDAGDGGPCTNTGTEVCDDEDNDCDGNIDEGQLPQVGDPCAQQQGECAGGVLQCTSGAITCSKPPMPEQCDNLDNDCDGVPDNGDPGGGAKCGTDVGECIAGFNRCMNGTVQCIGAVGTVDGTPESCNAKDDDCDGMIDDGLSNLGQCGTTDLGQCSFGTFMCQGGGVVCVGAQGPSFEICDNVDQDCDGNNTNGYNLMGDPQNCGMCGMVCMLDNAIEGCASGMCTIAACQTDFHNNDGNAANGCESGPCTIQGNEVCNGADDDCNEGVDEMTDVVTPPVGTFCATQGECATGTSVSCDGANGFRCSYTDPDVSDDGMGNILAETRCDGLDNDCDGAIDEGQPNLGAACDDGGIGACRGTGTFACDANDLDGPAVCDITDPGDVPAAFETCDNLDNDCDGPIDEGAATGNLAGQDWVTISGGAQMMKYEASKPDASATTGGAETNHACSKPGVMPWTNVTYPQAVAACTSVGARLCTEQEWHRTCSVKTAPAFPINVPSGNFSSTFEAEDYFSIDSAIDTGPNPDVEHAWVPDYTPGFFGISAMKASPNTGSSVSQANAVARSPRLTYQLDVAASDDYRVCVRAFSANGDEDTIRLGIGTSETSAPTTTLTTPSDNQWRWTALTGTIAVTAGTRFLNIYMQEDGFRIDRVHLTTQNNCPSNSDPPAGDEGNKWAYQSNPNTYQTAVCNGHDFSAVNDNVLTTGTRTMCHANNGANDTFDMSGNVKEWTLARQPGENPLRGGASNNTGEGISCPLNFTLADDTFFFPNVGFRCCR